LWEERMIELPIKVIGSFIGLLDIILVIWIWVIYEVRYGGKK
jgi:hypothetical protein